MATKPVYEDDVEETPEFTPRPTNIQPNPIFAAGEEQGKRQPSGDASVAEDYSGARTQPVAKKPAIVTKEQLAKSGFDNLRDYMNAQQGLTRRKDSSNFKEMPKPEAKPKTGSILDKSPAELDAMVKLGLQRQEGERAMRDFKAKKSQGYAKGGMTSMKSTKKMASGGSSASSRGDGIAQRGKTRGKMC